MSIPNTQDTKDADKPNPVAFMASGAGAPPEDAEPFLTTEQRLEQIIREADEEAVYHATEAKRRRGVAKAARQALNIQREGDNG